MADLIKPMTEVARNTRNTATYLHPVKIISPEYVTITSSDNPYSIATNIPNIRSVTFILWGVDLSNPVVIDFPNTSKTFDDTKYEGFIFSYAIDVQRDCELLEDITITIDPGEGTNTATVDLIYTTD